MKFDHLPIYFETAFKSYITVFFSFLAILWHDNAVIFFFSVCVMVLFLCSCSTPSRHMDLSISVMNISRQHCSWMKSRQISGWISPSSGLQREEEEKEQENREEGEIERKEIQSDIHSS